MASFATKIGSGTYGNVYSGSRNSNAVKIIKISDDDYVWSNLENALREIHALRYKSPHIVNLLDFKFRFGAVELQLERYNTDLRRYIEDRGKNWESYGIDAIKNITLGISKGLLHLHENDFIHRDVKPANILIDLSVFKKPRAVLCDLGLTKQFCNDEHYRGTGYVVTRWYRAPEVALELNYGKPVDLWSLGCILFEMCFGLPLFQVNDDKEIPKLVNDGSMAKCLNLIKNEELRTLCKCLLIYEPEKRFTALDAVHFLDKEYQIDTILCTQMYSIGGGCPNREALNWTQRLLNDFPRNERTIMHGLYLFQSSDGSKKEFDYAMAVAALPTPTTPTTAQLLPNYYSGPDELVAAVAAAGRVSATLCALPLCACCSHSSSLTQTAASWRATSSFARSTWRAVWATHFSRIATPRPWRRTTPRCARCSRRCGTCTR